jgi:hypothetical protein
MSLKFAAKCHYIFPPCATNVFSVCLCVVFMDFRIDPMLMPCKIYQHLCQHVFFFVGHTVLILLDITTKPLIDSASSIT